MTEGDITPSAMKCAMIGTLVVACLVGLSMLLVVEPGDGYRNWLMLIGAGILIAIFAFAYSAGPYPLSYHALGEVAVMGFYGLVPEIFTIHFFIDRLNMSAELRLLVILVRLIIRLSKLKNSIFYRSFRTHPAVFSLSYFSYIFTLYLCFLNILL